MVNQKFIILSDIHLNDWKQHNTDRSRLKTELGILDKILYLSDKRNIPVLFAGDLLQNPSQMSQYVLEGIAKLFNKWQYSNAHIYAISGNHDMSERYNNDTATWVNTISIIYPNLVTNIDNKTIKVSNTKISGIPFYRDMDEFVNHVNSITGGILIIHQELPGASDNNGFKVESVDNIPKKLKSLFGKFDLVICGHIHKRQELGNNILFPGAPMQQRTSDNKGSFGYYKLYDDLSYKFVRIKAPKFRFYQHESEIDNDYDYWVKLNSIKITPNLEEDEEVEVNLTYRTDIAKGYLKSKGIKSKRKKNLLIKYL